MSDFKNIMKVAFQYSIQEATDYKLTPEQLRFLPQDERDRLALNQDQQNQAKSKIAKLQGASSPEAADIDNAHSWLKLRQSTKDQDTLAKQYDQINQDNKKLAHTADDIKSWSWAGGNSDGPSAIPTALGRHIGSPGEAALGAAAIGAGIYGAHKLWKYKRRRDQEKMLQPQIQTIMIPQHGIE